MPKACEGGDVVVKLAPMRMADAVRQQDQQDQPKKSTGYVLPHLRKAEAAQTTATVKSLDTNSAQDFPTLGAAAGNRGVASASWSQIRNRFQATVPAAAAAPAAALTTAANQFAALDEDAATTGPAKATNFKKVIKDRIKREEAERQGLAQEEPTDPQLMTREQLERGGWAVLPLPSASGTAEGRAAWFAAYAAREIAKELKRDREFEALCEIYAPAGTVEPELRRPAARAAANASETDYESEPENEYYDEPASEDIEVY